MENWRAKAREWNATEKDKTEDAGSFAAYDLELFERTLNGKDD